jgi:hypothetical protein
MKELSIFVDESGDFGEYNYHSPYYIITMVFHNQENDIAQHIQPSKINGQISKACVCTLVAFAGFLISTLTIYHLLTTPHAYLTNP